MYFSDSKENLRKIKLILKTLSVLRCFHLSFIGVSAALMIITERCYEIMLHLGQISTSTWLITPGGKVRINKGGVFSVIIMRRCHIVRRKLNKMLKSEKGEEERKKIQQ